MKLRTTLGSTLAMLLLAGCSSVHLPGPIDQNCACQSDKPVAVKIGANGVPSTDRPILLVPRGSTKPIVWSLDPSSGYVFAEEGIRIEGRIVDRIVTLQERIRAVVLEPATDAFPERCRVSENRQQVTCPYRSAGPAAYKYTIKVQRPAGPTIMLDPLVVEM